MQCSFPKYVPRVSHLVPCQRCFACRVNRTSQWAERLMMELPYWDKACFITLTYDEEHILGDRSLHVEEIQKFFKRVRKNTGCDIKYYYCGEYGDQLLRCHYHAIVFGLDFAPWIYLRTQAGKKIFTSELLADCWQHRGEVTVDEVTPDSCAYVAGYVQKKLYGQAASFYSERGLVPPFAHQSNGISLNYAMDHKEQLRSNMFVWHKGKKAPLPHYVAEKVGLLDKDENGVSPMLLHAREVIEQRQEKFRSNVMQRYHVGKGVNGWIPAYNQYVREAGLQREIELQSKENK